MQTGLRRSLGSALDNLGLTKGQGKGMHSQGVAIKPLELEFSVDCPLGTSLFLLIGGSGNDDVILMSPNSVKRYKIGSVSNLDGSGVSNTFLTPKSYPGREYWKLILKDPDQVTTINWQSTTGLRARASFPMGGDKMFLLKNLTRIDYSFQDPNITGACRWPTNQELSQIPKLSYFQFNSISAITGSIPSGLFNSNMTNISLVGIVSFSGLQTLPDLSNCTSITALGISNCIQLFTGAIPTSIQALTHNTFDSLTLDFGWSSIPDLDMLKLRTFQASPRNNNNLYFKLPLSTNLRSYIFANGGNGYTSAVQDQFIDWIYTNRTSYDNTASKTYQSFGNIGSAVPGGTLQAPTGFSFGVSDGTPASAMEKVYVLVNQTADGTGSGGAKKYKWTFTIA